MSARIAERRMEHGVVRWYVAESGKSYTNYDCERQLKSAVSSFDRWFWRTVKTRTTWDESYMNDDAIWHLRLMLDDLQRSIEGAQKELDRVEGVDRLSERIRAMRMVAGRTPEEAAAFLAKADQLEERVKDG